MLPAKIGKQHLEYEGAIGPAVVAGQYAWIRFDTRSRLFYHGATRPGFAYNETTTFQGLTREVLDPHVTDAVCTTAYSSVLSWKPWMEMGDFRGSIVNNANGAKLASTEALPEDLRAYLQSRHPALLSEPRAVVDS